MSGPGLILLAAGGSKRMGRPKQLLPWGKTTLLRHAAETALATACRPVIVVLGAEAAACREQLAGLDVSVVENEHWAGGMGTSVAAGVAALEAIEPPVAGVMLMLVDQPTVNAELLTAILAAWSPERPIATTRYPEGGGVPAVFDRSYFGELRGLSGDKGARGIIARELASVALVEPPVSLPDLDTPELYRMHAR